MIKLTAVLASALMFFFIGRILFTIKNSAKIITSKTKQNYLYIQAQLHNHQEIEVIQLIYKCLKTHICIRGLANQIKTQCV